MKILHISHGFPPLEFTGVDTYTFNLARSQVDAGHQVFVFCRSGIKNNPEYSIKEEVVDRIRVTRINNNFIYAAYDPFVFECKPIDEAFSRYINEISPDIVHIQHLLGLSVKLPKILKNSRIPYLITLHDFWYLCTQIFLLKSSGELCPGPKREGARLVPCIHEEDEEILPRKGLLFLKSIFKLWPKLPIEIKNILWYKNSILRSILLQKTTYGTKNGESIRSLRLKTMLTILHNAKLLIAPSNFVKRTYANCSVNREKIKILGHPIDKVALKEFQREKSSEVAKFGFIGTFLRQKGADLLVDAFAHVKNKKCKLYIYGREGYDENLNAYIKKKSKVDPRIKVKGSFNHEKIKEVLQSLDVIIIPSTAQESSSYVLHEALYVGIPVIASNIETFKKLVKDGKNGFLFERNNPSDLAEKIELALKKKIYQKNIPRTLKENDIKDYNRIILRIYKNIANS